MYLPIALLQPHSFWRLLERDDVRFAETGAEKEYACILEQCRLTQSMLHLLDAEP